MEGTNGPPRGDGYRYGAFISYRHDARDRKWAAWLQRALESWRTPGRLVATGTPARVGRVFRDEEELAAAPHLSEEIETALRESRFLVVVCSPRTPQSPWVEREVARFHELGRSDRILALLIEGEPRDSFPSVLRSLRPGLLPDETGAVRPVEDEPLAADVRPQADERPTHHRRFALLRLLATLLGCRFDDLRRREQERRTRRLAVAGVAGLLLAGVMGVIAAYALEQERVAKVERAEAQSQRKIAEEQRTIAVQQREAAVKARQEEAAARDRSENLTEYMLFELRDQLGPVGRIALLRGVAERVVAYYESRDFAAMTPAEKRRYGAALVNLGLALEDDAHLEQAMALHERALAIDRRLHEEQPENLLFFGDVAVDLLRIGICLEGMGKLSLAEARYRDALSVRRSLFAAEPSSEGYRLQLAVVLRNLGDVLEAQGKHQESLEAYREDQELVEAGAPGPERDDHAAGNEFRRASVLAMTDTAEALRLARSALQTRLRLLRDDPQDRVLRRDVLRSRLQVAKALLYKGDVAGSAAGIEETMRGAEEWAKEDPDDVWASSVIVEAQTNLASMDLQRGRLAESRDRAAGVVPRARALRAKEPARFEFAKDLVLALELWAVSLALLNDASAAAPLAEEAIALTDALPPESAVLRASRSLVRSIAVYAHLGTGRVTADDLAMLQEATDQASDPSGRNVGSQMATAFASYVRAYAFVVADQPAAAALAAEAALPAVDALLEADRDSVMNRYFAAMLRWIAGGGRLHGGELEVAIPHLRAAVDVARPGGATSDLEPPLLTLMVADARRLLGSAESKRNHPSEALEAYRASATDFERLAEQGFMLAQVTDSLETVWDAQASLLERRNDWEGALTAYRSSLAASERHSALEPTDVDARIDVAISHRNVGETLRRLERIPEARTAYETAVTRLDAILGAGGGDARDWSRSAEWHGVLADVAAKANDTAAESGHRAASAAARAQWLRRLDPAERGGQLQRDGDLVGAIAAFREALAAKVATAPGAGGGAPASAEVAAAHDALASALAAHGDLAEALEERRSALALRRALAEAEPGDVAAALRQAQAHQSVAGLLERQKDFDGAAGEYAAAASVLARIAAARPSEPSLVEEVVRFLRFAGDALRAKRDFPAALQRYEAALERAGSHAEKNAERVEARRGVVVLHELIGMTHEAQKELEPALAAYGAGLAAASDLARRRTGETEWRRDVAVFENHLGEVSTSRGDASAARDHHRRAAEVHAGLAEAAAREPGPQVDAAHSNDLLAAAARAAGEREQAVAARRAAVEYRRRLAEIEPNAGTRIVELSIAHENLAVELQLQGAVEDSIAELRVALGLSRPQAEAKPPSADWANRFGWESERLAGLVASRDMDVQEALDLLRAAVDAVRPHPALGKMLTSLEATTKRVESIARGRDLLAGKAEPTSAADRSAMGALLYRRKRYRESVEQYARALEDAARRADPESGDLYNAACSAALAAVEGGADAGTLRRRALEWLGEDLRLRRARLAEVEAALAVETDAAKRSALEAERQRWTNWVEHARVRDADLASLRVLPEFQTLFPSDASKPGN